MSPAIVRLTGLAGSLMAAAFGIHAVAFRGVRGFGAAALHPVPFAAEQPVDFFLWIIPALAVWVLLVTILPAVWVALGRGLAPGVVCLVLFASAVIAMVGIGNALSHYSLSVAYIAADDASRVGLLKAADAVQTTVGALLNQGLGLWLLGAVGLAIVSATSRSTAPRWYGLLMVAGILVNAPLAAGPAIVWGFLNVAVFGAFTLITVQSLRPQRQDASAASPTLMPA